MQFVIVAELLFALKLDSVLNNLLIKKLHGLFCIHYFHRKVNTLCAHILKETYMVSRARAFSLARSRLR